MYDLKHRKGGHQARTEAEARGMHLQAECQQRVPASQQELGENVGQSLPLCSQKEPSLSTPRSWFSSLQNCLASRIEESQEITRIARQRGFLRAARVGPHVNLKCQWFQLLSMAHSWSSTSRPRRWVLRQLILSSVFLTMKTPYN